MILVTLALPIVGPFQIWILAAWVDRFTLPLPLVRDLAVKVGSSSPSLTITAAVLARFRPLAGYPPHNRPYLRFVGNTVLNPIYTLNMMIPECAVIWVFLLEP